MRPTTLPDPTSDAPCGIFASFPQSGSGAAPAAGAGEAHSAARGANGPHREGRRGKEGGGANNLHLRESNHRITRLSRRPPPSRKQAAVRDGRPFAGFRCGQVSPCLARISGPPQHRSSVSSTATASGRLHLGFFTLSPAAGNKLGEQRRGGESAACSEGAKTRSPGRRRAARSERTAEERRGRCHRRTYIYFAPDGNRLR